MERQRISARAHAHHPIAAPLGDEAVARLLERALPVGDGRILELGCGEGTWLRRALATRPGLRGEGVDLDTETVERAREQIVAEGFADRLKDAREFALVPAGGDAHHGGDAGRQLGQQRTRAGRQERAYVDVLLARRPGPAPAPRPTAPHSAGR